MTIHMAHPKPWERAESGKSQAPSTPPVKISIITACRNEMSTISTCLDSVATQSYPHVEHVVIDGDSQDGSLQRIRQDGKRLTIVFGQRQDGCFKAWNRGIGHATGDVVGFLKARDQLPHPETLAQIARAFSDPSLAAVYGNVEKLEHGQNGTPSHVQHRGAFTLARLCRGWAPPIESLFVRRAWLIQVGGFSPDLPLAADYDTVIRLFTASGFRARYLDKPVTRQQMVPATWKKPLHYLRKQMARVNVLRKAGSNQIKNFWQQSWKQLNHKTESLQTANR